HLYTTLLVHNALSSLFSLFPQSLSLAIERPREQSLSACDCGAPYHFRSKREGALSDNWALPPLPPGCSSRGNNRHTQDVERG
ncbi:MAG: hypothetical protein ACK53Y_27395, partial [bacterium]